MREGMGPSSSASREEAAEDAEDEADREEEARAQVTEGEPPPCRITSLVGRCRGGWAGAPDAEGGGGQWLGTRCPSEETATGRPREREEDTYSSAERGGQEPR